MDLSHGDRKQKSGSQVLGVRKWQFLWNGFTVLVLQDEKSSRDGRW